MRESEIDAGRAHGALRFQGLESPLIVRLVGEAVRRGHADDDHFAIEPAAELRRRIGSASGFAAIRSSETMSAQGTATMGGSIHSWRRKRRSSCRRGNSMPSHSPRFVELLGGEPRRPLRVAQGQADAAEKYRTCTEPIGDAEAQLGRPLVVTSPRASRNPR